MKPKKEHYRQKLPHYQQPGQWFSVTVSLEGAIPKGVMSKYSLKLSIAKNHYLVIQNQQIASNQDLDFTESKIPMPKKEVKNFELGNSKSQNSKSQLAEAKKAYYLALAKYRLAYDKFLHQSTEPTISLIKPENRKVIEEALQFWEGKKLTSHAWCIMSNHFHWVLSVFENDESDKAIYLEDVLHSVKLFTAKKLNINENLNGQLWAHESFETTIRNSQHFCNVFNYVINNPVSAGLVENWTDWPGTWTEDMESDKNKGSIK